MYERMVADPFTLRMASGLLVEAGALVVDVGRL
jgi:hypothetical protein